MLINRTHHKLTRVHLFISLIATDDEHFFIYVLAILGSILTQVKKTEVWTWGIIMHYHCFSSFVSNQQIYFLYHYIACINKSQLINLASLPLFSLTFFSSSLILLPSLPSHSFYPPTPHPVWFKLSRCTNENHLLTSGRQRL